MSAQPAPVAVVYVPSAQTSHEAPLAALGMPGCMLQVDALIIDAVFATGTSATWTLNIPVDPTLLTQQFFSQCGAFDIGVNAANLTVGNYCAATIGGK